VIYWDAKSQKLYGLNASGRSPYNLNLAVFKEKGLDQIPLEGPLSWSVPGCVSGWETLRIRFGSLPRAELLKAAIAGAEHGAPVPEVIAGYWRGAERALRATPEAAAAFLIDSDRAPVVGEMMKLPQLAATLKLIAAQGRDVFYKGPIAQKIVAYSQSHG